MSLMSPRTLQVTGTAAAVAVFLVSSAASGPERGSAPARRELTELDPPFRESVLRGWRSFQTSFARDGVACVHCHENHERMRLWACAYPKVEVFDGTPYEVKTLRLVVLEALAGHTDLQAGARADLADDLTAFIAWWGDGQHLKPAFSRETPPASMDLELLEAAVNRGRALFFAEGDHGGAVCSGCHSPEAPAPAPGKSSLDQVARRFPAYDASTGRPMTLAIFLRRHAAARGGRITDGQATDAAAYLTSLAAGKTFRPGGALLVEREPFGDEVLPSREIRK